MSKKELKENEGVNTTAQAETNTPVKTVTKEISKRKKQEEETKINLKESDEGFFTADNTYYNEILKLTDNNDKVSSVEIEDDGIVVIEVTDKEEAIKLYDAIDRMDSIETVEMEAYVNDDTVKEDDEVQEIELEDFDEENSDVIYVLYVQPYAEVALYDTTIIPETETNERYNEEDLYDDWQRLEEVKRRWKVTNKGKRRIKMQCKPGFKWNGKACQKIAGAELSKKRKATIRMVRSKKAQGDKLKRRVLRLSRKARRFRKNYGLK